MNEKRWLAAKDPEPILDHLDKKKLLTPRKARLFGVACCRRLVPLMPNKTVRAALGTAEQFADGSSTYRRLQGANFRALAAQHGPFPDDVRTETGAFASAAQAVFWLCQADGALDLRNLLDVIYQASVNNPDDPEEEHLFQAAFLRDIFGNPFRPVNFSPSWRTDTAVSLARGMYESRDFSAMPILADAIQDAGCDNEDVLTHCRDPKQVHVRGCWVVDLVLGK